MPARPASLAAATVCNAEVDDQRPHTMSSPSFLSPARRAAGKFGERVAGSGLKVLVMTMSHSWEEVKRAVNGRQRVESLIALSRCGI